MQSDVTVGEGASATFTYDADGNRVKSDFSGTVTYYIGNWYEKTGAAETKYYYFGGQRVAMRTSAGVTYIHGDRLGSATNTTGASAATQRYYPWGTRRGTGQVTTPYRFTGQREESTIGLYFYNARWYDPALGRFVQPDTIVPDPGNPQALNRYSYTLNNPVKYTDPSGHAIFEQTPDDPLVYSGSDVGTLVRSYRPSSARYSLEQSKLSRFAGDAHNLYEWYGGREANAVELLRISVTIVLSLGARVSWITFHR